MKRVFHFYSDCGHGWLKVPIHDLVKCGMIRVISDYSYQNGDYAYLEEDRDASLFNHILKCLDIKYEFKYHSCKGKSRIRSYTNWNNEVYRKTFSDQKFIAKENEVEDKMKAKGYSLYMYG